MFQTARPTLPDRVTWRFNRIRYILHDLDAIVLPVGSIHMVRGHISRVGHLPISAVLLQLRRILSGARSRGGLDEGSLCLVNLCFLPLFKWSAYHDISNGCLEDNAALRIICTGTCLTFDSLSLAVDVWTPGTCARRMNRVMHVRR
jgi:hypothetical protein